MNNKKGLSGVITVLIMILLVLVATGVVWVVIKNILDQGTEEITLGLFTINMDLRTVKVNADGSVDVRIKRNPGDGEITAINFVFSDGENSEVIKKTTTMEQLEERTFKFLPGEIANIGFVKEVSFAPVLETVSGKDKTANIAGNFKFKNEDIIKNLGGISWWRMNGDARDEIGSNSGTINGADCSVQGQYGKACSFDGVGSDNIEIADDNTLDFGTGDFSIEAWVKVNNFPAVYTGIITKYSVATNSNYAVGFNPSGNLHYRIRDSATEIIYNQPNVFNTGNWNNIIVTFNRNGDASLYVNGILDSSSVISISSIGDITNTYPIRIGLWNGEFNGEIDEVMIFDRALTQTEVSALNALDLS